MGKKLAAAEDWPNGERKLARDGPVKRDAPGKVGADGGGPYGAGNIAVVNGFGRLEEDPELEELLGCKEA